MKLMEYVESKEDPLLQIVKDTPTLHKLNFTSNNYEFWEIFSMWNNANKKA